MEKIHLDLCNGDTSCSSKGISIYFVTCHKCLAIHNKKIMSRPFKKIIVKE